MVRALFTIKRPPDNGGTTKTEGDFITSFGRFAISRFSVFLLTMSCERGIMGVVNKGKTPARIRPRAEVRSLTQAEKVVLSIDSMIIAYSPGEVKSLRAEMFHKF